MSGDLHIRVAGRAGRITFTRPRALNALNHAMSLAIEAALDGWRDDPAVALVVIDAEGDRAFCAGGDIAAMYHAGRAGGVEAAAAIAFWRDEYRMNAKISEFPKPVIAFMQGFVMGGGVGVGGHAAVRIAGDSTRIAMPETGIGLIPDVGGSWLLSRAPGRLGEYLGLTGHRMAAGDAILAGFADRYLPEADWPAAIAAMERTGTPALPDRPAPQPDLAPHRPLIDRIFALPDLPAILAALAAEPGAFAAATHQTLARMSPLSMAATLALVRGARDLDLRAALGREFRFTARALSATDFLEGVRAQIIDKDRQPRWRHADAAAVTPQEVAALLSPLPAGQGLDWEG
ncbi:3-hydroxyisobutyryl-CoA hydrolase [Frigidibacter oleivorans]|uniref:3-hydroxyisobutyryl-CoA hydrolase n=1 Tax=Frigidibacter oleivorans TaxID=2487129 RepID=UPI000F8D5FB6|nr:3-hydroxyisobutyryl-CoA hydrolase [Frigidibacter oleivorans]